MVNMKKWSVFLEQQYKINLVLAIVKSIGITIYLLKVILKELLELLLL